MVAFFEQQPGHGFGFSGAAGGVCVYGDASRHLGSVRLHGALESEPDIT